MKISDDRADSLEDRGYQQYHVAGCFSRISHDEMGTYVDFNNTVEEYQIVSEAEAKAIVRVLVGAYGPGILEGLP